MNLQPTAPTERGIARLRIVLTALVCGLAFTALATPQSAFAMNITQAEGTTVIITADFGTNSPATHELKDVSLSPVPGASSPTTVPTLTFDTTTITVDPVDDWYGTMTVNYEICPDGPGACTPHIVNITLQSVNDAPVANDDPVEHESDCYTISEDPDGITTFDLDTSLLDSDDDFEIDDEDEDCDFARSVLNNDEDPVEGDALVKAELHTDVSNGTLDLDEDTGEFTYMPDADFYGTDEFYYTAHDSQGGVSDPAKVTITVLPVLDDVELSVGITTTAIYTPDLEVTVPITWAGMGENVVGMNFIFKEVNECLTPTSVVFDAAFDSISTGYNIDDTLDPDEIRIFIGDLSPTPPVLPEGPIADVIFTFDPTCLDSDPQVAPAPLQFMFSDINVTDQALNSASGTVDNDEIGELTINTAPNDIVRVLAGAHDGNTKLQEGPIAPDETHAANLRTIEPDVYDPHYNSDGPFYSGVGTMLYADGDPFDAPLHEYELMDTCNDGADNDNGLFLLMGDRGEELHFNTDNITEIDYEALFEEMTNPHFEVCVRSLDPEGIYLDKMLWIGIEDLDEAPTAVLIDDIDDDPDMEFGSSATISEDIASDKRVGDLNALDNDSTDNDLDSNGDPAPTDNHNYTIISVVDEDGNDAIDQFKIKQSNAGLKTGNSATFDHETSAWYDVTIRADDNELAGLAPSATLAYTDVLRIYVDDINEEPTDLVADSGPAYELTVANGIDLNTPLFPALKTEDQDTEDEHTYSMVNDDSDLHDWPLDDPNMDDMCPRFDTDGTYLDDVVPGGELDNQRFSIDENGTLYTENEMNVDQSPYYICVRTTDSGESPYGPYSIDRLFTITVIDNNGRPIAVDDLFDPASADEDFRKIAIGDSTETNLCDVGLDDSITCPDAPAELLVLDNDTDPDFDVVKVKIPNAGPDVDTEMDGLATFYLGSILYEVPMPDTDTPVAGMDSFKYHAKDEHGLRSEDKAEVSLTYVQKSAWGDCNGDYSGMIPPEEGARTGDVTDALMAAAEWFESIGISWWEIHEHGEISGHPYGCNAELDMEIDFDDAECIRNHYLFGTCDAPVDPDLVQASSFMADVNFAIGSDLSAAPGNSVDVPVILSGSNGIVSSAGFFVKTDTSQLTLDLTDSDGNGIPDAVALNLPAGELTLFEYDSATGEAKIAVIGSSTITDGPIATITYQVQEDVSTGESAVEISKADVSSSTPSQNDIDATTSGGTVQIEGVAQSDENVGGEGSIVPMLYMPFVAK